MIINNPKVSVTVPVLNGEKTLKKCLEALIKQDFFDYEIIVVDNNSTDKTKAIINDFVNASKKVSYVFEARRGRGNARNAGVKAARGEVIAMTDADCIVPADWLEKITAPILKDEESAVAGFEADEINNYWTRMRQESNWVFAQARTIDGYITYLDTKNFAIKADLLKRLGFDSELTASEDWGLLVRLKKEGIKIKFLPALRVAHYHDASGLELFKTQFERGKNAALIIKSYQSDQKFKALFAGDAGVNSFRVRNFLTFIPWALWQFIINPRRAPYKVLDDFAWKAGIIAALISARRLHIR